MFKSFFAIIVFFVLLGCDTAVNSNTICKKNPELCSDLHKDSWCRVEKAALINNRFRLKQEQTPSGKDVYLHLLHLEKYNKCIELAAGVQHIFHPERTNDRARAFGMSAQSLAELQVNTKESNEIYLAYYHWTRFNDAVAQRKVLRAQRLNLIDDIDILAGIASYFQKFHPEKARVIYLDVFNRSDENSFNPEWLLGLANIYQKMNEFELTYLVSRANILMTNNQVSEASMSALINRDTELQLYLDEQAEELADALGSSHYQSSKVKRILEKD
ncbi:DUF2989 domain-containing protein [Shewanella sp. D64]|uniref:DUF2989 domain-containing protein n=1 Tax=unclassified Shewanella TaxID=196818 RepID=UPI0022BA67DF|nr:MULTISPECIES: DUF2989 domain-containing protein [unclassified Shewanella]MEC4724030.1 DUF2989 domain-containing protein [Shewanella sp. D64]MEC4736050.1 DUF2989 domain-containing protein [Shewanella sp. E94]WBJ98005.1 DUF2989 domain-containing protein [Shewanella sp. MTB7]